MLIFVACLQKEIFQSKLNPVPRCRHFACVAKNEKFDALHFEGMSPCKGHLQCYFRRMSIEMLYFNAGYDLFR